MGFQLISVLKDLKRASAPAFTENGHKLDCTVNSLAVIVRSPNIFDPFVCEAAGYSQMVQKFDWVHNCSPCIGWRAFSCHT